MGFLSTILKFAAPIVGGAVAGPLGAAVGGSLGKAITSNFASGLSGAASAFGQYSDQRAADSRANNQYGQTFAAQQALGEQANAQRIEAAQTQMDFQERMSSTSHQREIKDLAAAGLNPILSSKYGGSSTPGGALAQVADTHTPAAASAAARARQTLELTQMASAVNLQSAQSNKINAETANVKKSGKLLDEQAKTQTTQRAQHRASVEQVTNLIEKVRAETTGVKISNDLRELEMRIKKLSLAGATNDEQAELMLREYAKVADKGSSLGKLLFQAIKLFSGKK